MTVADQQKVVYDLSNGAIFNYLERHYPRFQTNKKDEQTDILRFLPQHSPRYAYASRGNKTILKPRLALGNTYTWDFSDVKFRVAAQVARSLDNTAKFRSLYDKPIG